MVGVMAGRGPVGVGPQDWRDRAACRGMDVELFVPPSSYTGDPKNKVAVRRVIGEVCGRCPVREQCLAFGLVTRSEGVWGGTTTAERRAMRGGG